MAKVFVSFLGTGSPAKDPGYDRATYNWPGKSETRVTGCFAQTAILKILEEKAGEEGPVDKVVFLCTKESKDKHFNALLDELREHFIVPPEPLVPEPLVPTDMTVANQWGWFEQLLNMVGQDDTLIIDFTHGMRAVPIVFSSAIGFLQRAKGVTIAHALYAWYDTADTKKVHPIVDMREFYVINDWAEAVARLADDADARKLGELARNTRIEALQPLADENLINAFEEMTDCIRNVDVNNVGRKVSAALKRVEQAQATAGSGSARVMLKLVCDKFNGLVTDYPPSGRYDFAYFQSQLEIIRVLLEHRLFMQAFTAMRECIGTLGMAGVSGKYRKNMQSSDGRKYRKRFAEIFVRMLANPEGGWVFTGSEVEAKDLLLPWFKELERTGIEPRLRAMIGPMTDTRNGFAHAWTAKAEAQADIEEKGAYYYSTLKGIIEMLAHNPRLH